MKPLFLILIFLYLSIHGTFGQCKYINPSGKVISKRFILPKGYIRVKEDTISFAHYLRNLPLKPDGSVVKTYNGQVKPNRSIYLAVIDMEIGKANLQQCADAAIRLRAEYLYKQKKYHAIHFNLTNGFNTAYSKWMEGYRVEVKGNKTQWVKQTSANSDYRSFRKYLDFVFAYAGTLSLSKELSQTPFMNMQIGDILIQGGSPGHAVIVIDMAENLQTKEKIYLLAQSYMPAQDIQVLQNPSDTEHSPWFKLDKDATGIPTPEWHFKTSDLKRFTTD